MKRTIPDKEQKTIDRRSFAKLMGGATAAFAGLSAAPQLSLAQTTPGLTPSPDTPEEIFTTALIAEDIATVFYYQALVGPVIQDPNLAGPGGTALKITTGSEAKVAFLRAALVEEIEHANFFRALLYGTNATSSVDPVQNVYFPSGTFSTLNALLGTLQQFKQITIAGYMCAVREFAALAVAGTSYVVNGVTYDARQLVYMAYVVSSLLGVESEHRALGRSISPSLIPANDYNFEGQNDVVWVRNRGARAEYAKLAPFFTPGSGMVEYSLGEALANAPQYFVSTALGPPGLI